jgi:DNA-binding transcriptional LysR family regulator
MPSMKSLRAFVLTMEQGSLTLAAQTMNLSQPAASRLVQQLEDEFGAPLFYRDSKTLTPSQEAEALYPEASRILASYQEFPKVLDALKSNDVMPLKVMGQTRCTLGLVAPALGILSKENPDITIDLAIHKRTELRRRMTWDRFDVGVFALPLHIDFAETRLLRRVDCDVILPKSHPLAQRDMLSPDDLKDLDYIAVKALVGKSVIEEAIEKEGHRITPKHEVTNAFAAVSLVRNGLGYMITDSFSVDPSHWEHLARVPIRPTPYIEYAICVSRDTREHPMRNRYIEILTQILDQKATLN